MQIREIKSLIEDFQNIFTEKQREANLVQHRIKTTSDKPIRSRPYSVPYSMRSVIETEIRRMLELGVIEKSDSPYASPVELVRKSDGSNRFCVDYRKLNRITILMQNL